MKYGTTADIGKNSFDFPGLDREKVTDIMLDLFDDRSVEGLDFEPELEDFTDIWEWEVW